MKLFPRRPHRQQDAKSDNDNDINNTSQTFNHTKPEERPAGSQTKQEQRAAQKQEQARERQIVAARKREIQQAYQHHLKLYQHHVRVRAEHMRRDQTRYPPTRTEVQLRCRCVSVKRGARFEGVVEESNGRNRLGLAIVG